MSVPKIELPLPSERGGGLSLPQPYLLFLGDTTEAGYAKTAFGLADWAADRCVGEWGIGGCTVTTGTAVARSPTRERGLQVVDHEIPRLK